MFPEEPRTPKYLQILTTLRQRITDGSYPSGSALPSEHRLAELFGVSRPTVLKALAYLKQEGWIDSQQGRANFVRGRPIMRRSAPALPRMLLDAAESGVHELISVAPVLADARIARMLNVAVQTPVYRRLRRYNIDGAPVGLAVVYLAVELAAGSAAARPDPLTSGFFDLLKTRRGVQADHAIEHPSARRATAEEADLLDVTEDSPVLDLATTVHDAAGAPVLAVLFVLVGVLDGLRHAYPLR